ncbi:MAG: APC family permease [bacterium]
MTDPGAGMLRTIKKLLVGRPLRTAQAHHERLTNPIALAIFASDALSSTAYATEEILMTLTLAGSMAVAITMPIAVAIAVLIAIVTLSYRQLIFAYPEGGGAYTVARENLNVAAGNVAGASLLIDYVLTVAVSTAAGIAALTSAVPSLHDYRVALGLLVVLLVTFGNLRGVRESGALFAIPSFIFIASFLGLIGWGIVRHATGQIMPLEYMEGHLEAAHEHTPFIAISALLILRGFSSGCTALTGLEAISNGTTAFRPPESRNAATVMGWMSIILAVLFIGLSFLAIKYHVLPFNSSQEGYQTVVSQIAEAVSGGRGFFYYLIQASTMVILMLAANTAFAGFPRLASLLARDGYLPHQFGTLGDKLVFTNGIAILAFASMALLVIFGGDTHALIPLYAIGVFLSFTIAQIGMVVKWRRERTAGWHYSATVNAIGATLTGIVLIVISYTKFLSGAWIVIVLIPLLIGLFYAIQHHYRIVAGQLSLDGYVLPPSHPDQVSHVVLIPISGLHRGVVLALRYARSLATDDVRAVYVNLNQATTDRLVDRWGEWGLGIPLVILESPYRSILEPLMTYVDRIQEEPDVDFITVLLPEFVNAHWWEGLLHNQTALMIRTFLHFHQGVVVTSVRMHLHD